MLLFRFPPLFMVGIFAAEDATGRTPSVDMSVVDLAFELQNPAHQFLYALGLWAMDARDESREVLVELRNVDAELARELAGFLR